MPDRLDMRPLLLLLPASQQAEAERTMRVAWARGWREIDFHPLCWELDGELHRLDLAGVSPRDGELWFLPHPSEIDECPP